jgi:FkbM family methyltransferase
MSKKEFLSNLQKVEKIAAASKLKRMLAHPSHYLEAILFRELVHKRNKKEKEVTGNTFFDSKMHLLLPSSTDIYLTGGKSHDSEIRLAKFLIHSLSEGHTFLDIGAHYGYFSLLASKLVGKTGKVFSFEAAPKTYRILKKNQATQQNMSCHNFAVSDETSTLTFYEFPNLYSEYNSLDIKQFQEEPWFAKNPPKEVKIKSIILDSFLKNKDIDLKVIKIDVEGAEFKVINGLKQFLKNNTPILVMEYLANNRSNDAHIQAEKLLYALGYRAYTITNEGQASPIDTAADYLEQQGIESDNIVFMK